MIYNKENYEKAKSGTVFEFTCSNCGKTFYKTKRQISKNSGVVPKYCSQRCYRIAHQTEYVTVVCEECGKTYQIEKCIYERKLKDESRFFCSSSCAAKYNNRAYPKRTKASAEEICPICGKHKSRSAAVCSECRKREKSNFVQSQELGYYIGYGEKLNYATRRCTEIRKDARRVMEDCEDVEKVCAYCHNHEFDRILDVHHIKGIMKFDPHTKVSEINKKENLVWLCPNHHRMLEMGLIELE